MSDDDTDDTDDILDYFNRSPFRDLLDIEVTEAAGGRAVGRLQFGEKHSSNRRQAIAQGGVAFSLSYSVAGAVASSYTVREGGETAVVDVEVVQPDGDADEFRRDTEADDDAESRTVAVGRGVYKTSDLPDDAPWDLDQGE
ncbi:hypothetical protein DJ71_22035 [Halorubrum sp. E3]|nr:hypothetical protein DJ71_22035 [Halorubrum sp. E3]